MSRPASDAFWADQVDVNVATAMLFKMYRIRMIEQAIADRYAEQEMRCPVHLSIGQECVPVAVSAHLKPSDLVVSAHRSHAHYLAKGGDLKAMVAELYGKVTGCARGRGGSMHLVDPKAGLVAAVPIVGSAIPIGVGVAWGKKLQKCDDLVVVYLGDGATEEGVFFESIDYALLHRLRVLFVVENNYYSVYTHLRDRQSDRRKISQIARGHGLESFTGDGNDAYEAFNLVASAIRLIHEDERPVLLEFSTYRKLEHCGPNSDDHLNYRDTEELQKWFAKDPIEQLERRLTATGVLTRSAIELELERVAEEVGHAFDFASSSPFPSQEELLRDVYAPR